ncbi:S1C family serine protease [Sinomonas susongensis]|uniref:S1C family serine protease n=1 Tax=Sinomonas susongensis TaxID=1324851 RepID=UPI001107BE6D|nr:trypsin-like peptidase domain-containing protein [Sinomonas susongensis]
MSETPDSPAPDRGQTTDGGTTPERSSVAPHGAEGRPGADTAPTAPIQGSGQPSTSQSGQPAASQSGQPAASQSGQPAASQSGQPAASQSGQYGQPRYGQYGQPAQPGHAPQGQYGQQGQSPYGRPANPYGQPTSPYGQQYPYGQGQGGSSFGPPASGRAGQPRRWGTGVLVAGMLVAGLVGGGVAASGYSLLAPHAASVNTTQNSPVIVNNQNSVNAVTAAAAKASPSVVTIGVTSGSSQGTGSGVVLDNSGHILTNTHVVTLDGQVANPSIEVRTNDGNVYSATVVGTDPLSDLAVIQIKGANLTPITVGDSSKINVGDTVIAIGAPLGLENTVTDGIVSTLNRTISVASSAAPQGGDQQQGQGGQGFQFAPPYGQSQQSQAQSSISINVIQTDAAINPGNSGGALLNTNGELVGINVAIASTGSSTSSTSQSGNIGVGFSIPIDYAKRIAQEIISSGKATHGQLGVSVQPAAPNGNSNSTFSVGAQVAQVTSGSPADKAGIKAGDVITHFGDFAIEDASGLTAAVREQAPGSTVKVTLNRNGQSMSVDVTVGTASS